MTNSDIIQKELDWLERVIKVRLEFPKIDIFNQEALAASVSKSSTLLMRKEEYDITLPIYEVNSTFYYNTISRLDKDERLLLILAICNQIESGFIDRIIERGPYAEMKEKSPVLLINSGLVSKGSYGYYPTGRFWLYILAGNNSGIRISYLNRILNHEINLLNNGLIEVTPTEDYEPYFGGMIKVNQDNLIHMLR